MKNLFSKCCLMLFVLFLHGVTSAQFQFQPYQSCVDFGLCFSSSAKNADCDLEICIIQSLQCPDEEPVAFRTCSKFRIGETGKLCFMEIDERSGCTLSVMDVTIRRVDTGETITLGAVGNPSTAQNFFDYATGHNTGVIALGVFQLGCDGTTLQTPHQVFLNAQAQANPHCIYLY